MKLFTFSADLIFDHDLKFAKMLLTIMTQINLVENIKKLNK